jgi:hypothetical protein
VSPVCSPPCFLCPRLGHDTAHFNVGNYRRKQKGADEVQDAAFFDSHNSVSGAASASGPSSSSSPRGSRSPNSLSRNPISPCSSTWVEAAPCQAA